MKTNLFKSPYLFICVAILVSLLAGYFVVQATYWGPWAFSDSATYVSAARNFSSGQGFVLINSNNSLTRVTEFPPLYSIFLSYFLGGNSDINTTLGTVNGLLLIIFLWIYGYSLFRVTDNVLLALIGMLLCLSSPVLMQIFTSVMSETLFFPLLYGILFLAILYIYNNNLITFIALVVLSCLLPITRYTGTIFVVVTAVLIFFLSHSSIKQKLRRSLIYLSVSLLPVGAWFTKLYLLSNKIGGKSINLNFDLVSKLLTGFVEEFNVLKTWLPYHGIYDPPIVNSILEWGSILVFIIITIFFIYQFRKKHANNKITFNQSLFIFSLVYLCAYFLFISFTHSITIPQIDIIDRMLAPVIPLVINMVISTFAILLNTKSKIPVAFVLLASIIIIRFNFLKTINFVDEMNTYGHGYSARQYQESGIIQQLEVLPDPQRMVSNNAAFILYYTNRFPLQVDQFANRTYGSTNGYGEESFREGDSILILLFPDFRNYYGETADQLLPTIINGLEVQYEDEIGGIYSYPVQESIQP